MPSSRDFLIPSGTVGRRSVALASMSQASLDFEERQIYQVSALNREARILVEQRFGYVWVEGEISNLARPSSGHLYFSLKDENAQVRCALFKQNARRLNFQPENGVQVLIQARVSLYEARGEFQLVAQHMEPAGQGLLQQRFEKLKQKLNQEGLFDPEHKQELPELPQRLGIITSPSGAAVRDVLQVLKRRYPLLPVLIYPVQVQGTEAPAQIVRALNTANRRKDCDVLLLTRGGGSLEDLWAFNDEKVARAVFESEIPVVCGVGHEIDVTIADWVADLRAPTPSAAAEMLTPDISELSELFLSFANRLHHTARSLLSRSKEKLQWLNGRLGQQHPGQQLQQKTQRVDELEQRLALCLSRTIEKQTLRYQNMDARLFRANPKRLIQQLEQTQQGLSQRLTAATQNLVQQFRHRLTLASRSLNQVSPLATLDRGYAIVLDDRDRVIQDEKQVQPGDTIRARLAKGEVQAIVKDKGK